MAIYAIGDVHGCFRTLTGLLRQLDLDLSEDCLWLVGDLVNRGPGSLEVLRWGQRLEAEMGERFVAVLGNHDLHLLAVHRGWSELRRKDTFDELLEAPDRHRLAEWLARRPLIHRNGDLILVHAGLLPEWTAADACAWGRRAREGLRQGERAERLLRRAGKGGDIDDPLWRALGALTRMRTLTATNEFCDFAGPPEQAPVGCVPWFERRDRRSRTQTLVVGHWAALGLRIEPGLIALDSGCAWGGPLTAIRLSDRTVFEEKNRDL